MQQATGEVSMTVITIVLLAVVLAIGMGLFGSDNSPGRKWINDTFNKLTDTAGADQDYIGGGALD